jgi:hypothetical protein
VDRVPTKDDDDEVECGTAEEGAVDDDRGAMLVFVTFFTPRAPGRGEPLLAEVSTAAAAAAEVLVLLLRVRVMGHRDPIN